jgi:phage anti-repressor protein
MEKLDIINLIESNPITKLSNTFNNKLLTKIKEQFTDSQQQLFISSFYCYLNYNQTTDFVIDLDNIWKWLEFSQKIRAKELLEKHFTIDIDYKNLTQLVREDKKNGGNNKETIMLNIKTFKLFCIKASTKKANEIHEYFIKLEELLHNVIQEESNELKMQLDKKNIELQINKTEFNTKVQQERHQFLLREFGSNGSVVYIIKVKTYESGEYVIKIGESRIGVEARFNEHKSKYEEALLLDCFSVRKSKDFEDFLHSHENIKYSRVSNLPAHENERELFLIGKNLSYKTLLHIISKNIKHFNEYNESDFNKLQFENDSLKQIITNSMPSQPQIQTIQIQELININKILLNKIDNLEKSNKEILEKINTTNIKTSTNFNEPLVTLGPRLQKIHPESLQLIKAYESVAEAIKEYNYKIKRPSINKAIEENTIYYGFRWMFVERDQDPNIITNLLPTKPIKIQNIGYIAKLNKEKTEILNVYLDRKVACTLNNYKSTSMLDEVVKKAKLSNGNYYILYDNCSDELKENFISINNNKPPLLYKDGIGQYDSNNNLINEFSCKNACIKQLQISDKSLTKALQNNIMYKNFYYKLLGQKLQCL